MLWHFPINKKKKNISNVHIYKKENSLAYTYHRHIKNLQRKILLRVSVTKQFCHKHLLSSRSLRET